MFKPEIALILLNKEQVSEKTYNNTLTMLQVFYKWGVKHKSYLLNPFEDVPTKRPKGGKKANPKREPLSEEEANKILETIKNDTHVPKSS